MTHDRRLAQSRVAEAALTAFVGAGLLWLLSQPPQLGTSGWTAALLALLLGATAAVSAWQYRVMDEFRRARLLRAWALAGYTGFLAQTGVIVWGFLAWRGAPHPPGPVRLTFGLAELYLPWLVTLATFALVTAFFYWRDVRGA